MRKLLREFKGFAMTGSMLDLALGFIIGAAFATLIESLTNNVLTQLIAAIFGKQDFKALVLTLHGTEIKYGSFLTDLLNFVLLTAVLFMIVKLMMWLGVGQRRIFGERHCPYCLEDVRIGALVCKWCRQPLVEDLPSLAGAEEHYEQLHGRRQLSLPPISLPALPKPALPKPNLPKRSSASVD